jgi:hypothetical protein
VVAVVRRLRIDRTDDEVGVGIAPIALGPWRPGLVEPPADDLLVVADEQVAAIADEALDEPTNPEQPR